MRLRIKEFIAVKGVTIKQVAKDIGVNPDRLYKLNIGQGGEPSLKLLQKLGNYFGVVMEELIENNSHPPPLTASSSVEKTTVKVNNLESLMVEAKRLSPEKQNAVEQVLETVITAIAQ